VCVCVYVCVCGKPVMLPLCRANKQVAYECS